MELDLLQMMYYDLAKRSKSNKIEKQTFLTFFHLNGLWGEQIFNRFDTNKSGSLEFEQLKKGIQILIKGPYQNKIHFLFAFYDIDKKNGISYDSLLKMLYSYPKQELSSIIEDEKFIKAMNDQQRNYHFGKKNSLDPLREVVEIQPSSLDQQPKQKHRKHSLMFGTQVQNVHQKQSNLRPWANKSKANGQSSDIILKKKSCSMSFYDPDANKTKTKISSNITLLVKKYASYLFSQFNLTKKDLLTQGQFQQLIKKHQRIFIFYFQSFHNYIWEVDESNIPQFIKNTSWVESPATVIEMKDKSSHHRYLRFYKTTIFVFKYINDHVPIDIINMEGLFVEQTKIDGAFGFVIKHRDGLYQQNAYIFKTKNLFDQWLRNLSIFMKQIFGQISGSIYDSYNLLEKIGAGKFSIVYKGLQKKTGNTVAVKVIQKFKFSLSQKQVIKLEVSILQLVHHPNIVKLIARYQSKTTLYIVTEMMFGGDLHDYVKSKTFLQQYETAIIIHGILQAVEYLNGLGIIHRDLKSENIMLIIDKQKKIVERAKIIDFGFAIYKSQLSKNQNDKSRLVGTPGFVAPQILLGQQFDQKVDVFSLGVIMYFSLTGQLPFDSIFMQDISRKTVNVDVQYNQSHWMNISSDARDLITKLLCTKQKRISVSQALKHPWIRQRNQLKNKISKNKRNKFI